jgi:hemoglobin
MTTSNPNFGAQDASFRAAGGEAGLRALVEQFYAEMDRLPEARGIRDLHNADLAEVKDKLARFLCGWLGGPKLYQEKFGPISIPMSHAPFAIGSAERDAWLLCMQRAVDAQAFSEEFKAYLMAQFRFPAERVRNRP